MVGAKDGLFIHDGHLQLAEVFYLNSSNTVTIFVGYSPSHKQLVELIDLKNPQFKVLNAWGQTSSYRKVIWPLDSRDLKRATFDKRRRQLLPQPTF
jgi:hypothetical protein